MTRSDFFKKVFAFAAIPFIPKVGQEKPATKQFMFGDGSGNKEIVYKDFSEFVTKSWRPHGPTPYLLLKDVDQSEKSRLIMRDWSEFVRRSWGGKPIR